ncbi:hypothetical protein FOL47_000716 [Perkinsus chesapeaki]|uniref:Uncharacterized protein n=1 Tax=Perkinsus chesapeaki TaxID=330153 RepID=A0A7J6ML00_PERCH|nr:hypothetical protein FOL47_000716 [Perkinsus chesapeaki]
MYSTNFNFGVENIPPPPSSQDSLRGSSPIQGEAFYRSNTAGDPPFKGAYKTELCRYVLADTKCRFDVCFEGLEEDLESKSMEGRSPGGSMNDSGELTDEDEYLKRVSRRDRKLEKYLFENNPTGNKAHRAVHLDKVNSTIRARLVPDPALVCRLSSSDDWRADRAGEGNYKVGGIGEMDGMPKAMPVMSGTEEAFANATSELIQNIPSGGMATVYQLLDFVANERYGKIAVFLIARCVQSTVGRFVNIGGIGAIPLRYMRLLALLARGTVQISAGGRGERGDEASKELEVSLCSLVGSLARLALDTSLPQSMAQNAQGGGYPMSPILPPKGAQTPRLAGRAARQSGVAAAVCDSLQLVSFRDMCSKCFMECSRLVDAPKLVEHVRLCVRDRWRNVAEKEAITRADVMALSSVIGVVKSKRSKEFEFDEGNVCSKWLLTDLEGLSTGGSNLTGPVTISIQQQRQLSELVETLRVQLVREAEERHQKTGTVASQLSEWLSEAKRESCKLRASLQDNQQKLKHSWLAAQRYEDGLRRTTDERDALQSDLSQCQSDLSKAKEEIKLFEKWKAENVTVDRSKLLRRIESLETQVQLAPNGDVEALVSDREDLKQQCSDLEESVLLLTKHLREVQIQNETILKTHVEDLRDEKIRQRWHLTGGNPNDGVMKAARELRHLRVKSEADDNIKTAQSKRIDELATKLQLVEKENAKLKRDLEERELHGPHLLPRSDLEARLEEASEVHGTSCRLFVENGQLREHNELLRSKAESYSTECQREKLARNVAERELRSARKKWAVSEATGQRKKTLEKHHEQAAIVAHKKYQVAEEKFHTLASLGTECLAVGLVRVRLLRGADGEDLIHMSSLESLGPHSALHLIVLEFLHPIEAVPLAFTSIALLAAVTEAIETAIDTPESRGAYSVAQLSMRLSESFPTWFLQKARSFRLERFHNYLIGGSHSAVLSGWPGKLYTFGGNNLGQLGSAGPSPRQVIAVSCGYGQTIALLNDGAVYACGQTPSAGSSSFAVEDPTTWYHRLNQFSKVGLKFKVALVSAGLDFTLLATTAGKVFGQGSNPFGALGLGTIVSTNQPVTEWTPVVLPKNVIAINLAAGCFHSAIVDHRGWLWVAGSDLHGRLGIERDPSFEYEKVAFYRRIFDLPAISAVALGSSHSMALSQDGDVWGWGSNERGQLGLGYGGENIRPVRLPIKNAVRISAGRTHSAYVDRAGCLWTCGDNRKEQCGWGFDGMDTICKFALIYSSIVSVACGWSHTIALRTDGVVLACGNHEDDRLGVDGMIAFESMMTETRYTFSSE